MAAGLSSSLNFVGANSGFVLYRGRALGARLSVGVYEFSTGKPSPTSVSSPTGTDTRQIAPGNPLPDTGVDHPEMYSPRCLSRG